MTEGKRKTALETSQAAATDRRCATFVMCEDDHIQGNSLWCVTMKKPEVEFCGYTKTHPSEIKFNLLIQMHDILPTGEVFQRGLVEAMTLCQP